jgi:cytochrome b pre-mRNA-processing protein 3
LIFAYDEGIAGDDTVLAAAVWRNLFHASKASATTQELAVIVGACPK